MNLNFCLDAVKLVCSNMCTNFFLHSEICIQNFSFVVMNSCTHANFVHEIRTKFKLFGKLGQGSYEFTRIREGYVMNGLYY